MEIDFYKFSKYGGNSIFHGNRLKYRLINDEYYGIILIITKVKVNKE